jgi:hypothetical protein
VACFIAAGLIATDPAFSIEQMLYDAAKEGDTVSDIACVLKGAEDGRTVLEVSILTKGQGAGFRRWTPDRPYFLAGSERITPVKTTKFYASKESLARPIGVVVFAAIGTQYVGHTKKVVSAPGEPVVVEEVEHTGAAEAIDRVGMAAGLGLLASQASGQITGLRATFDVTGREEAFGKKALLKFDVVNAHAKKSAPVTVPVRLNLDNLKRREIKAGEPNDPKAVADALLRK